MHIRISLGQIVVFDNSPHIPSFCISTFHYYNHADHNVVGGFLPLCVTPHSTPSHPSSSNLTSSFHTYTMNILYLCFPFFHISFYLLSCSTPPHHAFVWNAKSHILNCILPPPPIVWTMVYLCLFK